MYFPKFWKLVHKGTVSAWGWSDVSVADAMAMASKRIDRIISFLKDEWDRPESLYNYPGTPMREEVLREFRNSNGEMTAAVTRNSYGCEVLNAAKLLFVDIDEPASGIGRFFKSLFGKRPPGFEEATLANVRNWIATHSDWGIRAYRTRAGIRLAVTHKSFSPDDVICAEVFRVFGADPLYQRLCANQKCFRARLTPKSWRCGMQRLNFRWPWRDSRAESDFKAWHIKYKQIVSAFAVCRQLGHFGRNDVHPDIGELLEFHDQAVGLGSNLPLA